MGSVLWRALRKNRTLRYGAPMLLLIIGGSFGLREFTQIRYDAQKMQRKIDPALEGIIKKNKVTLESEFEVAERDKKNKVRHHSELAFLLYIFVLHYLVILNVTMILV
ncbi:cytochrome c oxidase assembly protein COX16 homolog, mitochondrial isoform X2 [Ascaphus truei]|uniref:cytochrome c oxidase assembly protein COX16 homolog, mitochondrial isoform X2 n=1 Tax=Ascaphus truei TaxID=8439 RepID=UPI003F5A0DAD